MSTSSDCPIVYEYKNIKAAISEQMIKQLVVAINASWWALMTPGPKATFISI